MKSFSKYFFEQWVKTLSHDRFWRYVCVDSACGSQTNLWLQKRTHWQLSRTFLGPPHFTNMKNLTYLFWPKGNGHQRERHTCSTSTVFCFCFPMHASAVCASLVRKGHDYLHKIGHLFSHIWHDADRQLCSFLFPGKSQWRLVFLYSTQCTHGCWHSAE